MMRLTLTRKLAKRASCLLLASLFMVAVSSSFAGAGSVKSLVQGPPVNEDQLGGSAYVTRMAKHADDAQFVFLNLPLLEDENVDVPASGITPQIEKEYEDAFHWIMASPEEQAEGGRKLIPFRSSIMGGTGIGTNYGDGRFGSRNKVGTKYFGATGLSANDGDFTHSYGAGSLTRGVTETIWGEVAQDFTWGSNRSFFLSNRGTYTLWPGGGPELQGLMGRTVPTRPAHYFERLYEAAETDFPKAVAKELASQDEKRIRGAIKALPDALPKPKGFDSTHATQAEKLKAGLNEYVDRLSEQYAFEKANRFFKNDVSSSNFELDGKLLDYDSMTAQPHYMLLKSPLGDRLGDMGPIKDELIYYFIPALKKYSKIPKNLIPSYQQLYARFDKQYAFRVQRNFVELTGLPQDLVTKISETSAGKSAIAELGEQLHKVAFTGAKKFVLTDTMPDTSPTYDLPRILVDLSSRDPRDTFALEKVLEKDFPNKSLRKSLISNYQNLMTQAKDLAEKDGISAEALHRYVYENSKIRNADISDMHRPKMRAEAQAAVDEYQRTGDRTKLWDYINEQTQKNRRVYRSENPYELIMMENRNPVSGITARHVYNAENDQFELVFQSKVRKGKVRFLSHEIPVEEFKNAKLLTSADDWSQEFSPVLKKGRVEFRVQTGSKLENVEFVLKDQQGDWLKEKNENGKIHFAQRNSIPEHPMTKNFALPEFIPGDQQVSIADRPVSKRVQASKPSPPKTKISTKTKDPCLDLKKLFPRALN